MKNADYWRQRARINSDAAHADANEYIAQLEEIYRDAVMSVQADIDRWYGRFAENNQITLAEARKQLTAGELEEFHWSVDKYIQAAEQHGLDPVWQKKLENASARYHISRLEAIQMQIQQQAELVYGNQIDGLDELLRRVADNGYNHAAFDVMKGVGMGWDFPKLDQKRLDALLTKPWTSDGKTFTDRCWEGKADLIDGIQKELTQSLLRGDSLAKTRDHIAQRFEVSKYKAGRLAHTEATYFNAVSSQACYEDLGVEKIEILETLDKHTCEICAAMDGKVIDQKDYQPGVTVPPLHPNCRGTTMPWFDDMDDVGQRFARDQDDEVYYVPPDMTYKEWEKTFQEGGSKAGVETVTEHARLLAHNSNKVPLQALDAEGFTEKFHGITGKPNVDSAIQMSAAEMLKHRSGTNFEDLHLIDAETGNVLHRLTSSRTAFGVSYDDDTLNAIEKAHREGKRIIAVHNHPNGLPPTLDDGSSAFVHGYDQGVVVGHNLEVWTYGKTKRKYTKKECESLHVALAMDNQFSVDFDDDLWYSALKETGMEVKRK